MPEQLKSCPCCDCHDIMIETMPGTDIGTVYRCVCMNCSLRTAWYDIKATAVEFWNCRADDWVGVEERLPEEEGDYLVLIDGEKIIEVMWLNNNWYFEEGTYDWKGKVTHWRVKPERPEKPATLSKEETKEAKQIFDELNKRAVKKPERNV